MKDYVIKNGDTFYRLSQQFGGSWEDWLRVNPGCNPVHLQVGQRIFLPELKGELRDKEQYAEIERYKGKEFAGELMDEVEMDIEGIKFKLRRIGEPRIPHEVHLILPRVEIRKIQPNGPCGPSDVQIMISNVNIAHSPRLMSEGHDRAESVGSSLSKEQSPGQNTAANQITGQLQVPSGQQAVTQQAFGQQPMTQQPTSQQFYNQPMQQTFLSQQSPIVKVNRLFE